MRNLYLMATVCLLFISAAAAKAQKSGPQRAAATILAKPEVLPATNVTANGFTANWKPVSGADGYAVFVYTLGYAPADGTYAVVDEDFNGVTFGSLTEPEYAEDTYMMLDDYTDLPNWSVYEGMFVKNMVGGIVYSPYIDLTNNGGNYRVELDVVSDVANDSVIVEAHATDQPTQKVGKRLDPNGDGHLSFDFTNGGHDTYFSIINYETSAFYVDRVRVEQDLKEGDKIYTMVALNESVDASDTPSADFPALTFAPNATEVYYDVYAAGRFYDDPSDPYSYEQYYSPFSDMQKVELTNNASIEHNIAKTFSVSGGEGFILVSAEKPMQVNVSTVDGRTVASVAYTSGEQRIALPQGFYVVRAGSTAAKVMVSK